MKKMFFRSFVAVAVICLVSVLVSAQEIRPVYVVLNGEYVDCASYGQEATIVEGRTLVPLRAIFEALGASVEWDQSTKTVTSELDGVEIRLTIGEKALYRNGEKVEIDVPAMIVNNRTLVPARVVAESFGVFVEWDSGARTVVMTHALAEKEPELPAIETDDTQKPSETQKQPALNEADVPQEAKDVLVSCLDAAVGYNFAEAAKYTTNPWVLSDLNITDFEGMLSAIGFDRDSIEEMFVDAVAEENEKENYRLLGKTMADVSMNMLSGAFEKIDYEIVSYKVVNAGKIEFETVLYLPDMDAVSEAFSAVLEATMYLSSAELMSMGNELEGKTEKEIVDVLASIFGKNAEILVKEALENIGTCAQEPSVGTLLKFDGEWLVELDTDDLAAVGELKKGNFDFFG